MNKSIVVHLRWIYARLLNVYHESENFDYMLRFKSIIEDLATGKERVRNENQLTTLEHAGLAFHKLPTDTPSQLADAFKAGMAWQVTNEELSEEEIDNIYKGV